ncbi:MAG: DUF4126 domain-containing protein [Sedimenticola sp.]|uniref:DUF4126 domain-containing protein n=1 Tax=Sedimenticola thiotaurini TaxID=1543721 RepID=A0A558DAL8_9GAMM|nr:DUF4126 domain-containing protein [Sedimenticola sp.]MDF1527780.1 DUF4126 domain-containing protein [Sedimenticola sp.]TVT58041.1 MAG: DUF4126 domain-containing protein [Sedimenticola thiotaurini]
METVQLISLTLGVAWASGINLYAAVLVLGYLGITGDIILPPGLELLTNPLVLSAAGFMYMVEFFADKTPGVDTGWDVLHTFIRIPAGAVLAAGMAQGLEVSQAAEFAALLIGGGLAATTHFTKTGTRVLINTSPEPFSNWTASITEDLVVIGGLWASLHYPWLFVAGLVLSLLLIIWLMPKLWRALKRVFHAIGEFFGRRRSDNTSTSVSQPEATRQDILRALYHDASNQTK